MLSVPTKKTALEPSGIVVTSGPLPGTEPGAGSIKVRINWRIFWWVVRVVILLAVLSAVFQVATAEPSVRLGGTTYTVRVADEEYERVIGLSTTESLRPNEGMLFVLNEPQYMAIWMKDMKFAIDIVWLDANKHVINVHHNVTPDTYPQAFLPNKPALYALELPAGTARTNNIQEGQAASFNLGWQ